MNTQNKKPAIYVIATLLSQIQFAWATDTQALNPGPNLAMNCLICHSPLVKGEAEIPSLRGKSADFISQKLNEFKNDQGDATIMNRIAKAYSAEQIAQIAHFISQSR